VTKDTTEYDLHLGPEEMHVVYIPISSSIPIFEISCTRCTSFGRNYLTTSIIENENRSLLSNLKDGNPILHRPKVSLSFAEESE